MIALDELVSVAVGDDGAAIVPGTSGGGEVTVDSVTHDSRTVAAGALFACLRGEHHDGHEHAADAIANGAVALFVDHRLTGPPADDVPQVVVDDTRRRLGPVAAAVLDEPSRKLTTVGITGTNGKTTVAAMLAAIFEWNGWPTGVVGTLHGARTTPEAPELQGVLDGFVREGRTAAVLEVSSHALALHRVDGTRFDAAVFTNIGHDHLDLHGTPEAYFRAKARLFTAEFTALAVVNVDDAHGRLLADTLGDEDEPRVVTYSLDDLAEVEIGTRHHRYRFRGRPIEVPLGGGFNVANSLAAVVTATELGIDHDVVARGLATMGPVPGRFQIVTADEVPFTVVVDYAHTPDGLAELLSAARKTVAPGGSVAVVFGCGGQRDQRKRPEMGAIAASAADRVVITSDNPRHEDPLAIIADVLGGIPAQHRGRVTSDPDRHRAIRHAIATAAPGDIVVIAGKGHETQQDLGDRTIEFDDCAVARSILEDLP